MTPAERFRAAVIARDGKKCALGPDGCYGRLQADHVIERHALHSARANGRLRRKKGERPAILNATYDELVADPRNGRMLCEKHHAGKWLPRNIRPHPPHVLEFAAEYDISDRLP